MVKAFISYSWDNETHKEWVRDFAIRLRRDGIDVTLDQWHLVPGDRLPEFMETCIRENDFILIVCTEKYKQKSNQRSGGVGYEGDIMSGELLTKKNNRKFIPILRTGDWETSIPTWLLGKYSIDLSSEPYQETQYQDLKVTLLNQRPSPPTVVQDVSSNQNIENGSATGFSFEPIKILGVIVDEVTEPKNDGTRGSALYKIPFKLNSPPPSEWTRFFLEAWDHPSSFTLMHRPGIASVVVDKIILNGSTIDEVEEYHRDTLILAVQQANKAYHELMDRRKIEDEIEQFRLVQHKQNIEAAAKRIKFD